MNGTLQDLYAHHPQVVAMRDFLELGGGVLALILLLSLAMWCLIFERVFYLGGPHRRAVQTALACWEARTERHGWYARQARERLISLVALRLERNLGLIETCVALCPLLGLLGTVTGMIEVFQVMAEAGSGNPRSMATGVSRATLPTLAGMVAALSGLGMSTWLNKRAARERAMLAEHLVMAPAAGGAPAQDGADRPATHPDP